MDQIIQRLNDADVRYLLIGGQAIRLMGMPRYSMDWDLYCFKKKIHRPKDEDDIIFLEELLK